MQKAPINKEMFREWQKNPVTETLLASIYERIDDCKNELIISSDVEYDRVVKGIVLGLREILNWEPEFEQSEEKSK